jgi:hypothetical protein
MKGIFNDFPVQRALPNFILMKGVVSVLGCKHVKTELGQTVKKVTRQ